VKSRIQPLFSLAILASLLLLPSRASACACCSEPGDYHISMGRPSASDLSLVRAMRFGGTANLFLTEADLEEDAKGLAQPAETYSLNGSLVGRAWKLIFRDGSKSGILTLPLPVKMLSYAVDTRDGRTSAGGGPLLYKEWRFEGPVTGTGIFQAGTTSATKYFLVFQGRGNACDNAHDFTHWRLEITGKKAAFAFYGALAPPK
jgi:hypothetical protein